MIIDLAGAAATPRELTLAATHLDIDVGVDRTAPARQVLRLSLQDTATPKSRVR